MKTGLLILGFVFLVLAGSGLLIAQTPEFNVCCEKTINGAWCQNTQEGQCDEGFRKTPTSCDATSYCKLGVCVDTIEGICLENTPQKVCEIDGGTWIDDDVEETPQCNLGCCTLGNQASFVTQTRCKRLSRLYGLDTDFRTDITDESSCILTAYSSEQGACVFQDDGEKTCVLTSRGDCTNRNVEGNNTSSDTEFFKDYLCSADELATNCGPTKETLCIDGRDEVYFKDSCGNAANIYDASRAEDPAYWRNIVSKYDSCGVEDKKGNAGDKSCGNCDYLSGSICRDGEAIIGDLICKDLNCYNTENGKNYRNGESWCIYQAATGDGQDPAGSRHFRHVCIHGEETIEPCGDFRNEVCIQTELGTDRGSFIEAACRVNRWVDCIDQHEEDDCLNTDKRDCKWIEDYSYDGSSSNTAGTQAIQGANENNQFNNGQPVPGNPGGSPVVNPNTADQDPEGENAGIIRGGDGLCTPRYPPGLEHWQDSNAQQICSLGNSRQVVHFEEGLFGDKKCKENCDVLTGAWVEEMNNICLSMGDCGNYINVQGRATDDGILVKDNGQTRKISQGILDAAFQGDDGFLGGLFG